MTLSVDLVEIWRQAIAEGRDVVDLRGEKYRVTTTRSKGLRVVVLIHDGQQIEGIEQNPETKSRWAAMAREGKRIMQFRVHGRYIGNVCEGTLLRYPGWKSAGLGE